MGSGLTLQFDKLSVLNLPKEAGLSFLTFNGRVQPRRTGQLRERAKLQVSFFVSL
jgi:hypothetical protein